MAEALPDSRSRIVMAWDVFLAFLGPDEQRRRTEECKREWGALPPAVEIHNDVLSPMWDDDPRFTEGM